MVMGYMGGFYGTPPAIGDTQFGGEVRFNFLHNTILKVLNRAYEGKTRVTLDEDSAMRFLGHLMMELRAIYGYEFYTQNVEQAIERWKVIHSMYSNACIIAE